jgi:hypothetical protein
MTTFKPHLATPVTTAGPAIMVPQVVPLRGSATPEPPPYEWNNPTFAYPLLHNSFTP